MLLTHRPVGEHDLSPICSFPQSAEELFFMYPKAAFPLTPAQLLDAIAQRADSTVAELDGEVAAFANFYRWQSGGTCAIGNVVVAPGIRGRGVGRYIIERMIDLAFAKHRAAEVTISCFSHNTAGLLLYPKLGFQPFAVEERRGPNGARVALIHLRQGRSDPESGASDWLSSFSPG